jgi:glycosyltransferase involved in cell wall biosynthesis
MTGTGAAPPLRVLFLAPTVVQYTGGTETVVAHLALRLGRRTRLTVLSGTSSADPPPAAALSGACCRLITVPFAGRDTRLNRSLGMLLGMNPFKVESRSFFRSLARAGSDLSGHDVVVTFYEMDAYLLARHYPALRPHSVHLLPGVSIRRFFRRVDPRGVHFLGYRAGPRAERKWGVRIPALPLGVDDAFFIPGAAPYPASRRLMYVGRLDRSKHVDWLADLFAGSDLHGRGYTLEVVGEGPLGPALRAAHRATPGIRLLGSRSREDLAALLRGAHLVLHPSSLESFGLTVLEAMAAGVPVITHELPAIRAWAGDRPVYAARLDRADWLAAIASFEDPLRWRSVSSANADFARSFDWDRLADRVLDILVERAATRGAPT